MRLRPTPHVHFPPGRCRRSTRTGAVTAMTATWRDLAPAGTDGVPDAGGAVVAGTVGVNHQAFRQTGSGQRIAARFGILALMLLQMVRERWVAPRRRTNDSAW